MDIPLPGPVQPAVGIFWAVREGHDPWRVVYASLPLAQAEPYGDFLTYPDGHYDVWEGWRRLGPAGLRQRGMPALVAWHEYEHFPRGRVVFDTASKRFTIYADRRLQAPDLIAQLTHLFGLDAEQVVVRSDAHYRSAP